MNLSLIIIILVFTILIVYIVIKKNRPYKHRNINQKDVFRFLNSLLFRTGGQGFLVVELPISDYFIQFSKYEFKNEVGLEFDFPLAPWSKKYYYYVEKTIISLKIKYKKDKVSNEKDNQVEEFLNIDFKQDINTAVKLSEALFREVFKLDENSTLTIYFGGGLYPKPNKELYRKRGGFFSKK